MKHVRHLIVFGMVFSVLSVSAIARTRAVITSYGHWGCPSWDLAISPSKDIYVKSGDYVTVTAYMTNYHDGFYNGKKFSYPAIYPSWRVENMRVSPRGSTNSWTAHFKALEDGPGNVVFTVGTPLVKMSRRWKCQQTQTVEKALFGPPVQMAMDGNRDGSIDYNNPNDRKCIFWVNDDYDVIHWSDYEHMWFEDDDPSPDIDASWPILVNGPNVPRNCDDNNIGERAYSSALITPHNCRRDLEDFTRMHIYVDNDIANMPDITFWLKYDNVTSGSPSANIFKAINETLEYLQKDTVADQQIQYKRLLTVGNYEVQLPNIYIRKNNQCTPFLLEGKSLGKGDITIIVKQAGNEIFRNSISLDLRPITRFYQRFQVSAVGQDSVDITDPQYNPDFASSKDYLIFVHGFNMDTNAVKYWPETIYKRLWWQGYMGQVGIFEWPNEMVSLNVHCYDNSEYNAWRCGAALLKILDQLNSVGHAGQIRIMAHSQGNIVVGEALRNAKNIIAQAYIASQAASASDLYCAGLEQNPNSYGARFPSTPNILDNYPGSDMPYFKRISQHVESGKMYNYYNKYDWALHSMVFSWEMDNAWKPDDPYYDYHEEDGDINTYQSWSPEYFFCSFMGFRSMAFPQDRFEIFSFAAEARSYALGTCAVLGFNNYDLQSMMNYNALHYAHSRQFLSNIADEWPYWKEVMRDCLFIK